VMIELVRMHGPDHQPVIGAGRHVRQQITEVHAALAMLPELARRSHEHGGFLFDEGEAHLLQQ